jgi:UDP-N-acetylmuramoyl-tripeptide--D-alanyl-D-alanine ligase
MIESNLTHAAQVMHGKLHGANKSFCGVSTDTRTIGNGQLFFALQGPNFDGNTFVEHAEKAAAVGAVTNNIIDTGLSLITVGDTRVALGELARDWRASMPAKIIGITGSNGKTTLKEMIASCLSLSAMTLATEGNLNNDIGMPLMLLRLAAEHQYAVIEMGANNPGEIGYLANVAKSDVVVITNAGPAHLEGFGSIEGVAQAKGEILETESRPEFAILNADDPYFAYWQDKASDLKVVSFGVSENADVRATSVASDENGSTFTLEMPEQALQVELRFPGAHNVTNACAAAAIATTLGIPATQIRQGLESARAVPGRLRQTVRDDDVTVYDDTYNANPASVIAAARFLAAQNGTNVLVLGDMGELGVTAEDLHRSVGLEAKKAGTDKLYGCGKLSRHAVNAFGEGGQWFESADHLAATLNEDLRGGWNVLVKGSRSMQMERVVAALNTGDGKVS